jgi:hypothetical protein
MTLPVLAAIFSISLLVRIVAAWWIDAPSTLPASAYEHGSIARYIMEGKGFSFHFYGPPGEVVPTSQQAPLMAGLLAGAYQLLGTETRSAFWAVIVVHSLVGAWASIHLVRATHTLFASGSASFWAGVLACFGPAWVIAPSYVQAVTFNLLALGMMIDGTLLLHRQNQVRLGILLVLMGNVLAWHVDPIIAVAGLSLLALSMKLGMRRRQVVVIALSLSLAVLPWTIRNVIVHGRPVLIKDSFWYVFWQGNTLASHGTDKLLVSADRSRASAISVDQTMPHGFRDYLAMLPNEVDRMNAFGPLIQRELSSRPWQYLQKMSLRARQWIAFDETNPRSRSRIYQASYLILISLASVGIWCRRGDIRQDVVLWIPLGVMTLFAIFVITSARFRIPAEFLLIPYASLGLEQILRHGRHTPPTPVALGARSIT